jgi:hypothetical protein
MRKSQKCLFPSRFRADAFLEHKEATHRKQIDDEALFQKNYSPNSSGDDMSVVFWGCKGDIHLIVKILLHTRH